MATVSLQVVSSPRSVSSQSSQTSQDSQTSQTSRGLADAGSSVDPKELERLLLKYQLELGSRLDNVTRFRKRVPEAAHAVHEVLDRRRGDLMLAARKVGEAAETVCFLA